MPQRCLDRPVARERSPALAPPAWQRSSGVAGGFRRPGRQLALVTVERDRVHLPGEAWIRRDDAALVIELDDEPAHREARVLGPFSVFAIEDRLRHGSTLAATRQTTCVRGRHQCTSRFPAGRTIERAWDECVRA